MSGRALWVFIATVVLGAGGWLALKSRASDKPVVAAAPTTLNVSDVALAKNPIVTEPVQKQRLAADLSAVGSVSYDQNHYAVVGPLVPGRVARLRAGLGDVVRAGQVLAEIESAEVGQAQGAYLSASARAEAAEANLRRERELAAERISSARDRELAEAQALSERAEMRAAVERMRAFGLSGGDVVTLQKGDTAGGRVPLRTPISGTVVFRAITLGQAVERATDAFKIVDLSHLWVLLDIYEKDLTRVHVKQKVELRTEAYLGEVFLAHVAYVNPVVDERTRTANVRIEFDNPDGKLRPGQFVTARLLGDSKRAPIEALTVPQKSVQTIEGKNVVFVRGAAGFVRRDVELGMSAGDRIQVHNGVREGEQVAVDGAFLLKSELLR